MMKSFFLENKVLQYGNEQYQVRTKLCFESLPSLRKCFCGYKNKLFLRITDDILKDEQQQKAKVGGSYTLTLWHLSWVSCSSLLLRCSFFSMELVLAGEWRPADTDLRITTCIVNMFSTFQAKHKSYTSHILHLNLAYIKMLHMLTMQ